MQRPPKKRKKKAKWPWEKQPPSPTIRVIVIDSITKTVSEQFLHKDNLLAEMQERVGGMIERACTLPNGDELYVDEEGVLKKLENFFSLLGTPQPYAGNCVIVGTRTDDGASFWDAKSELYDIQISTIFPSRAFLKQIYGCPA